MIPDTFVLSVLDPETPEDVETAMELLAEGFARLQERIRDNPVDAMQVMRPIVEGEAGGPQNVIWPSE